MRCKQFLSLSVASLLLAAALTGCGASSTASSSAASSETASSVVSSVAAEDTASLPDGLYTADFDTDSSMFHANEACDGKGNLTVKDGVEHTAVGVKVSGVQAVRQGSGVLGGNGGSHGRSDPTGSGRAACGGRRTTAGQDSGQQQGSSGQGKKLFAAHRKIPQFYLIKSFCENPLRHA